MEEGYVRQIGSEKKKYFEENFDEVLEKYMNKAADMGYESKLKFKKEKGKVIIFVVI
jgi:hypothetical protein